MPLQIRKLNEDEAAKAFPRHGQMDLSEYGEAVGDLQPGETAAMDLGDLTTRAAKRRLGQAAIQLGRRLRWARATDTDVVYFQVLAVAPPRSRRFAGPSGTGKTRRTRYRRPRSTAMLGAPTSEKTTAVPEPESTRASARGQLTSRPMGRSRARYSLCCGAVYIGTAQRQREG